MSDEDFVYRCKNPDASVCAESCVGLDDCQDCSCAVVDLDAGGPWGDAMDVIFCLLPIVFLLVVTIKPNPLSTTKSLPIAAILMFLVRVMYLGSDPLLTSASVILGLHEALTPLSIMAGAITLFESMEATKCMPYMMREMKALTAGHPVAELMLIFCFAYMIEGASGFGTPVALGAPMLVSTGHSKLDSVVILLIMNTFATVWGAAGTPIWFGFSGLATDEEFIEISFKAAIAMCFGSFLLLPLCLRIVIPWELVKHNLVFIFCSLASVMGPVTGIALVSFEFPALIGGMIGCAGTAVLIRFKVGLSEVHADDVGGREVLDIGTVSENSIVRKHFNSLSSRSEIPASQPPQYSGEDHLSLGNTPEEVVADNTAEDEKKEVDPEPFHEQPQKRSFDNDEDDPVLLRNIASETSAIHQNTGALVSLQDTVDTHLGPRKKIGEGYVKDLIMRTFPIWAVVVLLVVTRVEQIGVKQYLTKLEPNFAIYFGTYGTFRLSVSGVFQLSNILTYPGLNWKFELLYLPFLMPFVLVAVLTMIIFRKDLDHGPKAIAQTVASRLTNPALALFGALCLVQLLIKIDTAAPAFILGNVLADWFEEAFIMITPLLGALGAFFSGSTTVSNLTFGNIQVIAAESIGTSKTTMLALQAVGASAGNGICLNNIISACAVVGLNVGEGKILMQTYKFVFANTTIATVVMLAFFFRF